MTLAVLLALRFVLRARLGREKLSMTPRSISPIIKPISEGKIGIAETGKSPNLQEYSAVSKTSISKEQGRRTSRRVLGSKRIKTAHSRGDAIAASHANSRIQILIFYFSLTGSTGKVAKSLREQLKTSPASQSKNHIKFEEPRLYDISYVDYDEYFVSPPKEFGPEVSLFYLFVVPSYNIDTPMNTFLEQLQETHHDFRIDNAPLSSLLGYSVFGLGDREGWPSEEEGFCSQAKDVDKWMAKLTGRKRAFPLGMGDVKSDSTVRLDEWRIGICEVLGDIGTQGSLGEGVVGSGEAVESDDEDIGDRRPLLKTAGSNDQKHVDDVEDLGSKARGLKNAAEQDLGPIPVDFTSYQAVETAPEPVNKEMVPKSSPTYSALTKQGYTIVGSHSGVKICRWTKSALRGRGSCYKYSFYGIKSHLCMETTPSLSCSNKCVFCWRHGTNPVGTTWRWKVDPPDEIFNGVKAGHYQKIKMLKGVPGVRAERFQEAMQIKHCALSLVGEPIFYPYINEFAALLHTEHISSFLVCNAQHPDQLEALKPVTQLYVSIDASNRESLRKIDRPLHRDFWERFTRCLDILRENRYRQRTVFRLTLVKGFNVDDEVEGYAELVARGLPCFVEIKGVTFCGTSTSAGAGLTMQNVPFYEEVCTFVRALDVALAKRGLDYGIAAEHAHSCCVLLASTRFKINEKWHTLIDYQKFFELLESGNDFSPEQYAGEETPEWALWGNGGFDPRDTRVWRKGKNKKPLPEMMAAGEKEEEE
jgi:tRNA wybutosine-synthesizing protein 1